jgi:hypothetical protein
MCYLRYLCLLAYSGVQHILCFVFLCHVYPMLPVSLVCSFLIVPSVFSNVCYPHSLQVKDLFYRFLKRLDILKPLQMSKCVTLTQLCLLSSSSSKL